MLFAEDGYTGPSPNVLTVVLGQLGVVGALVWYLWYQTAKEMPAGRRDFLAALQNQREHYVHEAVNDRAELHKLQGEIHELVIAQQDLADAIREAVDVRRMPRPSRPGASPPGSSTAPTPRTPAEP